MAEDTRWVDPEELGLNNGPLFNIKEDEFVEAGKIVPEQKQRLLDENKVIKAFQNKPDVPKIDLGNVFAGNTGGLSADKLARLNEPIDKSIGVNIPESGPATERIATARTLGVNGAKDYQQFTYPLDDTRGAASSGTNEGDTFVADLGTGNAGLNISSSDTLRPIDGSEGNAAFFKSRYPALETTVRPFKVKIPAYNMEVESTTLDPEKLAFQVATMIGGSQLPMYIGYTNAGFDLTEPWYSTLMKGFPRATTDAINKWVVKPGLFTAAGLVKLGNVAAYTVNPNYDFEQAADFNKYLDEAYVSLLKDWDEISEQFNRYNGNSFTEFTTEFSRLTGHIPSAVTDIAIAYLIGAYSGGTATPLLGLLWATQTAGDNLVAMEDAPISHREKVVRSFMGGAASGVLNLIGYEALFGMRLSAGRQFITNYGTRMLSAGVEGLASAGFEGLTEYADQKVQDYVTMNMGDNQVMNRLDNNVMSFVLGAVGGLAGIPAHLRNEKIQIIKEQVLSGQIAKDAEPLVKALNEGVNALAGTRMYTREQAFDIITAMAGPDGQKYMNDQVKNTMLGMLDRLTPDAVAYAKEKGQKQAAAFIQELNNIDQSVYESLPDSIDESTRVMVSRAVRSIGALVTYYGGNFRMPKFEMRDTGPMEYDDKANIVYINPNARGEAADISYVQDRKLQTLDPIQRGILHELGHMLDAQLGKGTNFKEFLPAYFDAIAKVYGKEKAQRVAGLANKEGNRLEFAKSEKPEDVTVKQMDKLTGSINERNTTEWFAYAAGRLGRKVGRIFGFADSEVSQYIDAANIIATTAQIPSIQESLNAYQQAMNALIKKNDATLKAMAKAQGEEGLARKIQDFVAGNTEALSKEDVLALYNILKTYTGVDGGKIIDDAFKGTRVETFMERTEREFAEAIREEGRTVGEIQDAIAKREGVSVNEETTTGLFEQTINIDDIIKTQSKQDVSGLEKRTAEKPDGMTYQDDVKAVASMMKEHKAPRKWFSKLFGNGDLVMSLWTLGGQKLVDHFDLVGKMNRASTKVFGLMEEFDTKLKKELGFDSNIKRDEFNNTASIDSIDAHNVRDPLTDQGTSLKISPLVAMNLYLNSLSTRGYQKVLNTFNGDVAEVQHVLDSLTPEQKKYADLMMNFVKEHWKYYKESFKQEGEEIEEEPYWPIADAEHIAMGDRKINSNVARREDPNGMISLEIDAREVFNSYVQRMVGGEEHIYATIRRMKDIFGYEKTSDVNDYPTEEYRKLTDTMWENSKRMRAAGTMKFGSERGYNQFVSLLNDFLEKREQSLVGLESLNIAARNLTSGLLMFKPIQFVKNLTNASMFWGLADNQALYWKDTAWAATHPIEAAEYMMEKVPLIRERLKGQDIDEAFTQQMAGSDSLLMNWAKKSNRLNPREKEFISKVVAITQASKRLGFTPMLGGDAGSNVIGGYGVLKQYEAKYGDKAGDRLSEDIIARQASNNQATRSLLQREWSRDIRGELIRFASEPKQKAKSIALDIAKAQAGEQTWGTASKRILSTMSSMILFALVSAGILDLFDDDEENNEEVYKSLTQEGISALAGASIVGNSIIAPMFTAPFLGGRGGIGTPMTSILSSDIYKLSKGDWKDLALDSLGATAMPGIKSAVERGGGIYGAITAETPQELKAGLIQAGGSTQNKAQKRASIKKEKVEKKSEE